MNQIIMIAATLAITLTTNEVKIGTATIGYDTFDVVALQVVTNRVVELKGALLPPQDIGRESWTNTYAGPFIRTNLVKVPAPKLWGTNIWIQPIIGSNWIYTIPAINQN